jgi:hypothetical protein
MKERQNEFLTNVHKLQLARQASPNTSHTKGTNVLKRLSLIFIFVFGLSACAQSNPLSPNNPTPDKPNQPVAGTEPYVVKGRVVDLQGRPLENVQIIVDNTIYYNSAMTTTTDANGEYFVRVEDGSWRVYAEMKREYNGRTFEIDLMADTFNSFAGMDGAVRNFVWQLQGEKPEPLAGFFGGDVYIYNDPMTEFYDTENVEFTLTPVGSLIDGSTGETIITKHGAPRTDYYSRIVDVPLGRYEISGRYLPTGEQVLIRMNGEGNYGTSLTIDFEEELNYCTMCVALEVTLASEVQGQSLPLEPAYAEQPMNVSETITISGKVYAPLTEYDVSGTVVALCYQVGEGCDNERSHFVEVTESGWSGEFTISGLEPISYYLFAIKDETGNGEFGDAGDFFADYGVVTPSQNSFELQLEISE